MRPRIPTNCTVIKTDKNSIYLQGEYHEQIVISVLDETVVRVRHLPDGEARLKHTWSIADSGGFFPKDGHLRDEIQPFETTRVKYQHVDENTVEINTAALHIRVYLDRLRLEWRNQEDVLFVEDSHYRAYQYDRQSERVFHYMNRHPDEKYYGLGEKSGKLDKAGRRWRMVNLDTMGYDAQHTDPLYKHWPFYITYNPEHNLYYGLFYDNFSTSMFDFGQEIDAYHGTYRYYQSEMGDLDYYLFYGPTLQAVASQFTNMIGRSAMIPRYALGYLGSTMTYTEAPDAQAQLKRFVELCEEHDIPCDLFHLSSGYTTGEDDGLRYVFNWNYKRVPDPETMTTHFHEAGIQLSANIKPYFLKTHPKYAELEALGYFIRRADEAAPETAILWSGGAYTSAEGAYLDFTNPDAYAWWQAQVKAQLLEKGIDSTWNDNNEYELWDDLARCHGFGDEMPLGISRPIQTLLMVRASYEAQLEYDPNKRPFVLTRSASPGVQRYAQTWTGDNATSWETLQYNIPMGLGMSLSGMPNIGHDVGGFFGPQPEPELFIRWLQCGIFHPRFTIHSFNTDGTVNEPWMHPEILPLVREIMQLRYQLIPHLYSLFYHSAVTGEPIIAPLFYHFSDDPNTHTRDFEFMLGAHILVAPVYVEGQTQREVYLPSGTWWCHYQTQTWYAGGQTVTVPAPLEEIPLFVRNGGLIIKGKAMKHIGAEPDDFRSVELFAYLDESANEQFILFEDDGVSNDYQQGIYTKLELRSQVDAGKLSVTINQSGDYPLPYDKLIITVMGSSVQEISIDDENIALDAEQRCEWNVS